MAGQPPRFYVCAAVALMALVAGACTTSSAAVPSTTTTMVAAAPPTTIAPSPTTTTSTTTTSTTTTTTTTLPTFTLSGTVTTANGEPVGAATITVGDAATTTTDDGNFSLEELQPGPVTVTRPAWVPLEFEWDGDEQALTLTMEPFVVRALRVSRYTAEDPEAFAGLLDLAAGSAVNALVFDTKDESGTVLYDTTVQLAHDLGAVDPVYDPVEALAAARDLGLYTITRIVSFEDPIRVKADPTVKLAGSWVDATLPEAWEYLYDLAVEACELGFDEIQFDYVRFPAGLTAKAAQARRPTTSETRLAAVSEYLTEARNRLHPMGCAVSADIFAIVMSSPTDEGIGQRPEELSVVVDAISPMIYPSHYSPGWLGFDDPNAHPGPVVAYALDQGAPRMIGSALIRPWLQAFYYNSSQVLIQIEETEARGHGWMLWNAAGNYSESALPPLPAADG